MSTITCLETGKQENLKRCSGCFFHRLPDDVSIVYCRVPIYKGRTKAFEKQLWVLSDRYIKAEREIRICMAQGKIEQMQKAQKELESIQKADTHLKEMARAAEVIFAQAKEINDPVITATEELLYEHLKTESVSRAILSGKDLKTFLLYIKERNGDPEELAREYFEIG